MARDAGIYSKKRIDWYHGIVGPERQAHTILLHRVPGVRAARALRAKAVSGPTRIIEKMRGLHGGDDLEFSETGEIAGLNHLRVLHAIAPVARAIGFAHSGERIERDAVCAVAYGVKGELKTGMVAFDGHLPELFGIHTGRRFRRC